MPAAKSIRANQLMRIHRFLDHPIIPPNLHPSIGENVQGPSLIRTPDWLPNRLGAYYLYFADHNGKYIRMAYADRPQGPWTIYKPGTLQLAQSYSQRLPPHCEERFEIHHSYPPAFRAAIPACWTGLHYLA